MTFIKHLSLSGIIFCLVLFSSCKTHHIASGGHIRISKSDTTAINDEAAKYIQLANDNRIPYDWFATRIKVE